MAKKKIDKICEIARRVFASPNVKHELPRDVEVITPNPSHIYDFQSLKTKVIDDDTLNQLVLTWIAARAKARRNIEIFYPVTVSVHWHSELLRTKNPQLKDVAASKFEQSESRRWERFEQTWKKQGLLVDNPLTDFEFRRIPVRFRNVPDWLMRQECDIPEGSPTLKSFWESLPESATYEEIDRLISETTKDWRYLPIGWKFKFSRVELEPSSSDQNELLVFLDDNDSRKKALYAPFSHYNPYEIYDPEHVGSFY